MELLNLRKLHQIVFFKISTADYGTISVSWRNGKYDILIYKRTFTLTIFCLFCFIFWWFCILTIFIYLKLCQVYLRSYEIIKVNSQMSHLNLEAKSIICTNLPLNILDSSDSFTFNSFMNCFLQNYFFVFTYLK